MLFSNEQVNDEVLSVFTDPAGNASFDEFLDQAQWVEVIDAAEIRDAASRWLPADQLHRSPRPAPLTLATFRVCVAFLLDRVSRNADANVRGCGGVVSACWRG